MNNLDLKILALLFSVILWLIVVNIDDPVKTVQFSGVEVQIMNAEELEAQGKVYDILDNTGEITVTVKGRRSIVEDIAKENISAVADMKDLTSMDTLSIEVTSNKYANELDDIKSDKDNVRLSSEDLKKVQKVIEVKVTGEPDDGYITGALTTTMNQIYLEGPESLINKISYAQAQINVDGVKSNVSSSVPIKLYDALGKEINDERISMNIDTVSVNQEILMTKEVPVEYRIGGKPAEGYALTGVVESDVQTVLIAGRKSVLDEVESIVIPESVLNVDGLQNNLEARIKLHDYLPGNVIFVEDDMNGFTKVNVEVQKETFVTVSFTKSEVTVTNLPEGYQADILADGNYLTNQETVLKVYGLASVLEEFDADNAKPNVDMAAYMLQNSLTELSPGVYNVAPDFGLPEGAYIKDNFKIQIRISE